jgi:uncharacterized protein
MGSTILTALGLVFVIEGLTYAAFPSQIKRMLARLLETSDDQLRVTGTLAVAFGVFVVWISRWYFLV